LSLAKLIRYFNAAIKSEESKILADGSSIFFVVQSFALILRLATLQRCILEFDKNCDLKYSRAFSGSTISPGLILL
jgi:DNA integrity scanning protein DisA with diadenylate cyclase activity